MNENSNFKGKKAGVLNLIQLQSSRTYSSWNDERQRFLLLLVEYRLEENKNVMLLKTKEKRFTLILIWNSLRSALKKIAFTDLNALKSNNPWDLSRKEDHKLSDSLKGLLVLAWCHWETRKTAFEFSKLFLWFEPFLQLKLKNMILDSISREIFLSIFIDSFSYNS